MRASYFLSSALLALFTSVTAGPLKGTDFILTQWVEDVIAGPNGNHLSPSEAVAAIDEARASTSTLKRANCETSGNWGRANVRMCLLGFHSAIGPVRPRTLLLVWKNLRRKAVRASSARLDPLRGSKISAASAMQRLLHRRARRARKVQIGEYSRMHPGQLR